MAHSGFGPLTIKNKEYELVVPQNLITKDGEIYKTIQKLIDRKDYAAIEDRGITVRILEKEQKAI
jgi:hypothetical protein